MSRAAPARGGPGARWRWRVRLAATALAGAAGLALGPSGCPRPDFAAVAERAGPREREVPLPALVLPEVDLAGGNGLEAIFIARRGEGRAEVTLVFADEDQPFAPFDLGYDLYRWFAFGRVADVETFIVELDPPLAPGAPPRLAALDLADVYGGAQTFAVPVAEHDDARLTPSDLSVDADGRPLLYVTTWNHMLCERDTNPTLAKRRLADPPLYRGSRVEVEALYRAARSGGRQGERGGR